MKKNIRIPEKDFIQLDQLDRIYREYSYIATMTRENIIKLQADLLDPETQEKWKKGFVNIEIDWKHKNLVIIPTEDPERKAEEVSDLLKKNNENLN